jgi:hypothetical protein
MRDYFTYFFIDPFLRGKGVNGHNMTVLILMCEEEEKRFMRFRAAHAASHNCQWRVIFKLRRTENLTVRTDFETINRC